MGKQELSSAEVDDYSYMLSQDIQLAIDTKDKKLISAIRKLWDNEPWESIVEKFQTEGSVWVVWFEDGLRNYIESCEVSE